MGGASADAGVRLGHLDHDANANALANQDGNPNRHGYAVVIIASVVLAAWLSVMPGGIDLPWRCGYASYYAPGVMERVTALRQPCDYCVDGVATVNRGLLGQDVWLWRDGDGMTGPYRVVDVAQREHVAGLVRRGRVIEVSWDVAQRWGMSGPVWACMVVG